MRRHLQGADAQGEPVIFTEQTPIMHTFIASDIIWVRVK
jgi:hypothetical protein